MKCNKDGEILQSNLLEILQYIWEQAEFDIIGRKTRISLHFDLKKQQKKLRHAFSYSWRL